MAKRQVGKTLPRRGSGRISTEAAVQTRIQELPDFVRDQMLGPTAKARRRTAVAPKDSRVRLREAGVAVKQAGRRRWKLH